MTAGPDARRIAAESDARRIAAGPPPSASLAADGAERSTREWLAHKQPVEEQPADKAPYDPLRLCIYATIALLGWLAGPVALVVFASVGFAGYWKARRVGLKRSRCFLRDTRLVLAYFAVLIAAGAWGIYAWLAPLVLDHWLG